ncbi:MAG: protein kinase [Planctomycetaceae bacterium]|jgi:WD40 repeat protein/serine/threonine protein kinase|nr:protein kinase [Planctomycetaceae bacterium]
MTSSGQRSRTDSVFEVPTQETEPYNQPVIIKPKQPAGAWNVGEVILDIYEVKEIAPGIPFAAGGVGIVNRVYHREWDIDLAVKSPRSEFFQTENGKRSYEKEAQTWIELGLHPNIVTCYLVRRIDEIPRLFAEFVPDGSLKDWVSSRKLYNEGQTEAAQRILDIAIQFCWGLHHAHRQGLLHLDVKPANVMMAGGIAKVSDFGLSRSLIDSRLSDTNAAKADTDTAPDDPKSRKAMILASYGNVGLTPGYCSPEQFNLVNAIKKLQFDNLPTMTVGTDIWSWAVSLLGLYTGGPPCKRGGQTARQVCESVLHEPPLRPELPEIPKAVGELLLQCFEEDPKKRPASMEEIADRLISIYADISGKAYFRHPPISAAQTPESINNQAVSMLDLNQPESAAKLFSKALTLQPWHPEVTYNQTLSSWRLNKLSDSAVIERLEMLVKMQPESSSAMYALGLVQRERGNTASAFDAFSDALEIEDRSDVRKTAAATAALAGKTVRSLDRFGIAQDGEDSVLVDRQGGYILYAADEKTLQLRSTVTGQVQHSFKVNKSAITQSGRLALSEDLLHELLIIDGDVALRRMGAAKYTCVFSNVGWQRYFVNKKQKRPLQCLCSEKKIIGQVNENGVVITDITTSTVVGELSGHNGAVTAFTMSFDGRFALTGCEDRCLRIWELPSCRCLRTLSGLRGTVEAVHFGINNCFALSLMAGGEVRLWDIAVLCTVPFHAPILLSYITSSGEISRQQYEMRNICNTIRENVTNSDYGAALENIRKAETMKGWNAARITFEADGTTDTIRRHCVRESLQSVLCTHTFQGSEEPVSAVAVSLNANIIASAGRDTKIWVWNVAEQKSSAVLQGHRDWVRSIALTSDSKFLVSGSWDSTIRIWNIQSGRCIRILDGRFKQIMKIVLNPQGTKIAAATGDGTVVLLDALSNKILNQWQAHSGIIHDMRFNRSGHYLVTGGEDNKVCLWRCGNESPVKTITVHQSPVMAVSITADASQIISGDAAGRIALWNLEDNTLLAEFYGHIGGVSALSLLPDARFLLSASKDTTVRLTRLSALPNVLKEKQIEGHPDAVTAMTLDVSGRRMVTGCEDGIVRIWELSWNFMFPGGQPMSPKAELLLRHLAMFYSADGETFPQLSEAAEKRILLEMEYRGFGMIPAATLKEKLTELGGNG